MNIIKQIFDLPDTPSGKKLRRKILNRFPIEKKDKIEVIKKIESGELKGIGNNTSSGTEDAVELKGTKFFYVKYIGDKGGLIGDIHVLMGRGTGYTYFNSWYTGGKNTFANSFNYQRDFEAYAGIYIYKNKQYNIQCLADLIQYHKVIGKNTTYLENNYSDCTKEEFENIYSTITFPSSGTNIPS